MQQQHCTSSNSTVRGVRDQAKRQVGMVVGRLAQPGWVGKTRTVRQLVQHLGSMPVASYYVQGRKEPCEGTNHAGAWSSEAAVNSHFLLSAKPSYPPAWC